VNLATVIEGHPGQAVALVEGSRVTSYAALGVQAGVVRGGLARLGLEPGDRVALVSDNHWAFVVAYLAVLGMGAVAVPLNPSSSAAELERDLTRVGPAAVVVGPGGAESMAGVDPTRAGGTIRFVLAADGAGLAGARPFSELYDADPLPPRDLPHDHPAALLFTAGTGGPPRLVALSHGNLWANVEQAQRHPGRIYGDDVTLAALPLFHVLGLNAVLGLTLAAGASLVLVGRFDAGGTLAEVAARQVTVLVGVPTMYAAWAAFLPAPPESMASVRLAVSWAAPLRAGVADAFERRFGLPVHQGYGLTEASPMVSSTVLPTVGPPAPGSVGVSLPGIEVRLVDEEGLEALPGDPGELWVRGPNVFAAYWDDEASTAAARTDDGWLRTGDVAVSDAHGQLYLVDRAEDRVVVSGFSVSPSEVEAVLMEHPGVVEAAVTGVPHPYAGQAVRAHVVAAAEPPTAGELAEHCALRLARYECPTEISFVPSLPYGMGGKLVRRALLAPPG